MYPYTRRLTWYLRSRYEHALDMAAQATLDGRTRHGRALRLHSARMRQWLRWRVVVLVLILLGYATLGVSLVFAAIQQVEDTSAVADAAEDAQHFARRVAGIAGSFSGALTLAWLAINRVLGEMEVDILGILALSPRQSGTDTQE